MVDTRITLSATWVVVMLIYLLGDVLRIISGDVAKMLAKENLPQYTWLIAAVLMLIPILIVFLNLVLPQTMGRWVNIIVAGFFILFNLVGLPTYPSLYDKFLLLVSMVFNGVTIWYAWNWV
jgi:cytochrome bd-type quinol oxidase subunit 2